MQPAPSGSATQVRGSVLRSSSGWANESVGASSSRWAFLLLVPVVVFVAISALETMAHAGPLTRHMGLHIALMNVLAPVLAALSIARSSATTKPPASASSSTRAHPSWPLAAATVAQLGTLWLVHAPGLMQLIAHSSTLAGLALVLLTLSALFFWRTVLAVPDRHLWRAILALLVTGKLVCLLAAIVAFAPRALYGAHAVHATLADQHVAGMLMLAACPLTYIAAAIWLATRWLTAVSAAPAARPATAKGSSS